MPALQGETLCLSVLLVSGLIFYRWCYPLRDTGGVNDLGKKLRSRTFSACILNSNAESARDEAGALMDALDAPGSGELVHPDFGTVDVMVDSWECRTKADELNYYAFTVTV